MKNYQIKITDVELYPKIYKDNLQKVLVAKKACHILMPQGTKVAYNVTTYNTFFNIQVPDSRCIELDTWKILVETGLDILNTIDGHHKYYLHGMYKIECCECTKGTLVVFYKVTTKYIVIVENDK